LRLTSTGATYGDGTVASGVVNAVLAAGAIDWTLYELVCVKTGYNNSTAVALTGSGTILPLPQGGGGPVVGSPLVKGIGT
jgi:hypothetical protein